MKLPTSKRLREIVTLLEENEFVKAKELSKIFNVSMETIRKDLRFLEERGVAKKEYGGASLSTLGVEKSLEYRKSHQEEKDEIARSVASLLSEHHSIILDSGTTCQACVQYINLLSSKDVVTNSIESFNQLNGNLHNVFLSGGKKREKNHSLIGAWSEQFLSSIHVDVCLLGTSGLLESNGPTAHSYQELSMKKIMIQQSDLVFVLADSSKFQEKGFHTIADWSQIDGIISDHNLSPKLYEQYSKRVPIYVAKEENNEENS